MLDQRASRYGSFLQPLSARDYINKSKLNKTFTGTSMAPVTKPKQMEQTSGISSVGSLIKPAPVSLTESLTSSDDRGSEEFKMGHTVSESVRKPIDESVLRKIMDGRLAKRKESFNSFWHGGGA